VFFQGVYLMTSIGLNITRRTQYYPVSTAIAAAANIGLNFALIPRYGIMGAAYANGIAYAMQAALAYFFSQRFYPVTYEWGRLVRVAIAAALAYAAGSMLPPMHPILGVLLRGATVVVVMIGGLWVGGFLKPEELGVLQRLRTARQTPVAVTPSTGTTELAGEIVATDLPVPEPSDEAERVDSGRRR
jgi:O-antigen/teichoic acid export membrane protein